MSSRASFRFGRVPIGFAIALASASFFVQPSHRPWLDTPAGGEPERPALVPPPLLPSFHLWTASDPCDGGAQPEGARPASSPQTWVVSDDYPVSALMMSEQGRTAFRLTIDPHGDPIICSVTGSSGHPALDGAACTALMRRARFDPARDERGCPIPAAYTNSVVWQIPQH